MKNEHLYEQEITRIMGGNPIHSYLNLISAEMDAFIRYHPGIAAHVVLAIEESAGNPSSLSDKLRRIIVAGLPYESATAQVISDFQQRRYGNLSGDSYKDLTYRKLVKYTGSAAMALWCASGGAPMTVLGLLAAKQMYDSWTSLPSDLDFSPTDWASGTGNTIMRETGMTMQEAADTWPQGPMSTANRNPGAAAAVTVTASPVTATTTNGVQTMTAATTTAATINPATAGILNAVLAQTGITTDIEGLLASHNLLPELQQKVDALSTELVDARQQAAAAIAKASSALPSTINLTPTQHGLPTGKMTKRKVADVFPILGKLTFDVPTFDWDHAHPDVPAINHDYVFRKPMLLAILRCLTNGDNIWLQGHTGSGKTTAIEQVAARLGWPVARIAFDSNVDRPELVGRMQLIPDGKGGTESKWLPGIIERATSNGYILLCDEMDAGHPNAVYVLQPVLEGKPLTLLEDSGRVVPRHPFARVVATGNTTGNGDPSGLYPACRILSAATLDRFPSFAHVPYMTTEEEETLLLKAAPSLPKATIKSLTKFGHELRKAFTSGETPISYSPRRSIAFARQIEELISFGMKDQATNLSLAFKEKLYDAAPEEHRQRLLEIANATLGGNIDVGVSI